MPTPKSALSLLLALLVLATAWTQAAPRPSARAVPSLDGQCLVATAKLNDPHFAKTVVFVIAHNREGAMGLILNRTLGTVSLQDLFGEQGIENAARVKVELRYGGPVENNLGFVLHSDDYAGTSTQLFRHGLALSTGLDIVKAVAAGRGPKRSQFLSGYAGWAAGQLESEIARGDWLAAPADPELILSPDPAALWEKALRHAGLSL